MTLKKLMAPAVLALALSLPLSLIIRCIPAFSPMIVTLSPK